MTTASLLLETSDDPAATDGAPLSNAWIYWKKGDEALIRLRTDADGFAFILAPQADERDPDSYTEDFTFDATGPVDVFYSLDGPYLEPNGILEVHPEAFFKLDLTNAIAQARPHHRRRRAPVTPSALPVPSVAPAPPPTNTLVATPTVVIVLPNLHVVFETPTSLAIWPVLFAPFDDTYLTDGLAQGAALFAGGHLALNEGSAGPVATRRPGERGLRLRGRIDATVTSAVVEVFNGAQQLNLKSTPTGPAANHLALTLTAIAGSTTELTFEATLFFADIAASAGLVRIAVVGTRATVPKTILAGLLVAAVGVQNALVDDQTANANGTQPGPVPLEANEVVVVDFPGSPAATEAAVRANSRARRMVEYSLHQRNRPYNPSVGIMAGVPKPEMPMWMAELHLWGLVQKDLLTLLAFRKIYLANHPTSMRIDLQWQMDFSWRGPDGAGGFQYAQTLDPTGGAQGISFALDKQGALDGLQNGVLTKAFATAPTVAAFPVGGRRLPKVTIDGVQRAWGRAAGAPSANVILIEWQPVIADATGNEMMRGGDGTLRIDAFNVDGVPLDRGISVTPSGTKPFDPATPPANVPTFRIAGEDPPLVIDDLIDAVTQEIYAANPATASITFFTLAQWQITVRMLIHHESRGHQFTLAPRHHGGSISNTFSFRNQAYGEERGMPLFGPPHGYGIAQLDTPRPTVDQLFSFVENVKGACHLLMVGKAAGVWTSLHAHLGNDQRSRAVYQREVVRRYNGFGEFHWNGTAFEILPTLPQWEDAAHHNLGANSNLPYPNQVLGTHVIYSTGHGAATVFPWPIVFQPAHFGPGV